MWSDEGELASHGVMHDNVQDPTGTYYFGTRTRAFSFDSETEVGSGYKNGGSHHGTALHFTNHIITVYTTLFRQPLTQVERELLTV